MNHLEQSTPEYGRQLPTRTKSRVIKGGEWRCEWTLTVGDHVVDAGELHFSDTVLAAEPSNVGWLTATHLSERATVFAKKKRK